LGITRAGRCCRAHQGTRNRSRAGKEQAPAAIAKIVEGKLRSFTNLLLLDQGFVKRNSEVTLKEHVAAVEKQLGDKI